MADYELTTPVVEALVARLTDPGPNGLGAQLAAVAAQHPAEAAMLMPPASGRVLDHVPLPSEVDPPTIGLQDAGSRLEDDTGSSSTGRHQLGVVVFLASPDQGVLARGMRLYLQAVARVVLRGRGLSDTVPGAAFGVGMERIDWGPTLGDSAEDPREFLTWAVLTIWARREEQDT